MLHNLIPECSQRPGDDPIFALNGDAQRRAAAGEDILNATLGALMEDDGSLAIMPSVFEAYRRTPPERASAYAPISGPPAFLKAVVTDLFGEGESANQCVAVATPGGTGAVHHAIVNYLEPGQKLLTSSFYWGPYGILADHTRRGIETFESFNAEGAFNAEAFEQSLLGLMRSQGRALVIINTPCHNPTGYSLDDRDWEGVVKAVERASELGPVAFLLDFAYAKFAPEDAAHWRGPLERIARCAAAMVAWTASKSFAQYGARVGSLVALVHSPDERIRVANALGYSCRGTWSNCNHLGMLAIAELLNDPELRAASISERKRLTGLLAERVEVFNGLARPENLRYPRYEGGFFVTIFTAKAQEVANRMRAEGVFVVPLPGAIRLALCATPSSSIERLVRSLVSALKAEQG